jgi:BirA family transcriptional regulator, biotin operon repressor / biotin---[acetyl-CoA-carboxylase] ligase
LPEIPIIELNSIDSTNNYAMQLIDANKAQHGLTIVAQSQSGGKGQRGKTWIDAPGQSLLMSIITMPAQAVKEQFVFNASVTVAIVKVLQFLYSNWDIKIKWPNDIIINDKKAGGILIENVLRGSKWAYSVIGLGLNVKQEYFPAALPHATSLKIASGASFEIAQLCTLIRENILMEIALPRTAETKMSLYNGYLYKKGCRQRFTNSAGQWEATILNVHTDGSIEVQLENGTIVFYHHGQVLWDWG